MIRSGIPPFDAQLGGFVDGRMHVVTGGPGSGKTTACLQFIAEALREGEPAAMLTVDRPHELRSHARFIGFDLDDALRDGRLLVLRCRPALSEQLGRTVTAGRILDDLERLLASVRPTRLAIDPLSPFLGGGSPSTEGIAALTSYLERSGVTSLLTYCGNLAAEIDRRLEPLVERSAAIVRLSRDRASLYSMDVVSARFALPAVPSPRFLLREGAGLVIHDPSRRGEHTPATPRRLVMLHTGDSPSEEMVDLLRREYEVVARVAADYMADATSESMSDLSDSGLPGAPRPAAVVIETTAGTVGAALATVQRLARRTGLHTPIVLLAGFTLRSSDRARALRFGADEVLGSEMGAGELLQRLGAVSRRGHLLPNASVPHREAMIVQKVVTGGVFRALEREEFSRAVATHVSRDNPTQYAVVSLAVDGSADEGLLEEATTLAMRSMRASDGDLVAVADGRVLVYLHGARARDVRPFVERVRRAWSEMGHRALRVEALSYPSDEPQLRTMLAAVSTA